MILAINLGKHGPKLCEIYFQVQITVNVKTFLFAYFGEKKVVIYL